jgi:hypothetical protein
MMKLYSFQQKHIKNGNLIIIILKFFIKIRELIAGLIYLVHPIDPFIQLY